MLEAIIRPRIRRTLLEHILQRTQDRFYLRGLAKDLHLSISPLRRELKRLEEAGMLLADEEGNIRFYHINPNSPLFLQLKQLSQKPSAPSEVMAHESSQQPAASSQQPVASNLQPTALPTVEIPLASWWRVSLSAPLLIGITGLGLVLMLIVVGIAYLSITNQRLASSAIRAVAANHSSVSVKAPSSAPAGSASGVMRGARWQIVPGGFGGFSSGASDETY